MYIPTIYQMCTYIHIYDWYIILVYIFLQILVYNILLSFNYKYFLIFILISLLSHEIFRNVFISNKIFICCCRILLLSIFVYGLSTEFNFIFSHMDSQWSQHHLLKSHSFLYWFCTITSDTCLFSDLLLESVLFHWSTYLLSTNILF